MYTTYLFCVSVGLLLLSVNASNFEVNKVGDKAIFTIEGVSDLTDKDTTAKELGKKNLKTITLFSGTGIRIDGYDIAKKQMKHAIDEKTLLMLYVDAEQGITLNNIVDDIVKASGSTISSVQDALDDTTLTLQAPDEITSVTTLGSKVFVVYDSSKGNAITSVSLVFGGTLTKKNAAAAEGPVEKWLTIHVAKTLPELLQSEA